MPVLLIHKRHSFVGGKNQSVSFKNCCAIKLLFFLTSDLKFFFLCALTCSDNIVIYDKRFIKQRTMKWIRWAKDQHSKKKKLRLNHQISSAPTLPE